MKRSPFFLSFIRPSSCFALSRECLTKCFSLNVKYYQYELFRFTHLSFGLRDVHTDHSGCPVMVGEKFIANTWIRNHKQTGPGAVCRSDEAYVKPYWIK